MAQKKVRKPQFAALSADECWAMLERNHIGRVAFVHDGRVTIEPVHYVAADSWIFIRSAGGAKLEAFTRNPYVAFEVDEVEGTFDWRSVVANGTVYLMSADGSRVERAEFARALRALRSFIPQALTRQDPTPFRLTIYGIHVDAMTGRVAEAKGRSKRRPLRQPKVSRERRRAADGS